MFFGAATAGDGRVVFAPSNANGVGVFDPTDDSFILVDISGEFSGMSILAGTTTVGDGRVVFAPHFADGVGVFDPAADSFALFDISDAIATN